MQLPDFHLDDLSALFRRPPGAGAMRAAARLADHRKAFAHVDMTPVETRQQRRCRIRLALKIVRADQKKSELRARRSSFVRSPSAA